MTSAKVVVRSSYLEETYLIKGKRMAEFFGFAKYQMQFLSN